MATHSLRQNYTKRLILKVNVPIILSLTMTIITFDLLPPMGAARVYAAPGQYGGRAHDHGKVGANIAVRHPAVCL